MTMAARSLLIVDDHASFRQWARKLFERSPLEVVGEADDGASALAAVDRLRPDVVLLDVRLPDIDGIEVATRIASKADPPIVILTSTADAVDLGRRLLRAPAAGFLTKSQVSVSAVNRLATR